MQWQIASWFAMKICDHESFFHHPQVGNREHAALGSRNASAAAAAQKKRTLAFDGVAHHLGPATGGSKRGGGARGERKKGNTHPPL